MFVTNTELFACANLSDATRSTRRWAATDFRTYWSPRSHATCYTPLRSSPCRPRNATTRL